MTKQPPTIKFVARRSVWYEIDGDTTTPVWLGSRNDSEAIGERVKQLIQQGRAIEIEVPQPEIVPWYRYRRIYESFDTDGHPITREVDVVYCDYFNGTDGCGNLLVEEGTWNWTDIDDLLKEHPELTDAINALQPLGIQPDWEMHDRMVYGTQATA